MAETADVVIIGGGVMGASIAFHLAHRRAGKIVLLEKSHLAAGSSGKSGAIIRQYYSHPLLASMAQYGLRVFKQFPEIVGGVPVFTHTGMIVAGPAGLKQEIAANVAMQQQLGIDVKLLSPEEVRSIDPNIEVRDDDAVAYESETGYCEAPQVVASLAVAARHLGVKIREGVRATGIRSSGGRISGVMTSRGEIATTTVVVAAGAWAEGVASWAGASLPVKACRTQVALVRRPCDFGGPHPVVCDLENQLYIRPTHGEMTHVGNIDPREENAVVDADSYNEVADEAFVQEVRQKFERRFPALRRGWGRGGFGALYAITPDWHPIVDRLPGVAGAFCAAGFSGHGFKMAPAVGQLICELVVDGRATTFDIAPLRADRFAEGSTLKAKSAYKVMG